MKSWFCPVELYDFGQIIFFKDLFISLRDRVCEQGEGQMERVRERSRLPAEWGD